MCIAEQTAYYERSKLAHKREEAKPLPVTKGIVQVSSDVRGLGPDSVVIVDHESMCVCACWVFVRMAVGFWPFPTRMVMPVMSVVRLESTIVEKAR